MLIANELLDAMPVHQVVMREDGLREVYVDAVAERTAQVRLDSTVEGPLSTPALAEYLDAARRRRSSRAGAPRSTCGAVDWIREAARRLRRGFVILIDYGHEARELYSATHSAGTLTTFARHTSGTAPESTPAPRRGSSTPASRTSRRTSTSRASAPPPRPKA